MLASIGTSVKELWEIHGSYNNVPHHVWSFQSAWGPK